MFHLGIAQSRSWCHGLFPFTFLFSFQTASAACLLSLVSSVKEEEDAGTEEKTREEEKEELYKAIDKVDKEAQL